MKKQKLLPKAGKTYKMKKLFLSLLFISSAIFAQTNEDIEKIKKLYAPDKRTAIFEIRYNSAYNSLVGKTNLPKAKKAVLDKFFGVAAVDSIQLLPDSNSKFHHRALVNVSVANLRSQPEEWSELSSQILLGVPLKVLEKYKGWYRVQSPDMYIGWIDGSTISQMSKTDYDAYKKADKYIYLKPSGFAKADSTDTAWPVRDLSFGNIFLLKKSGEKYCEIILPDGTSGFVEKNEIQNTEVWLKNTKTEGSEIIKNAYKFLGIPYLWGGTSFKGVDCSGFSRMTYFSQGLFLPRDASQQALKGELVKTENNFADLLPGDLLFFGNTQTLRVSHVAVWLGNQSFIHSSGMVQINSFDKNSPVYDEYNLKRLLFVKRINPNEIKFEGKNLYKF